MKFNSQSLAALATLALASCGQNSPNAQSDTQANQVPRYSTFLEYCKAGVAGKVSQVEAETLDAMTSVAQGQWDAPTDSCEDAAKALANATQLSLGESGISDVRPLVTLKSVKYLAITNNNISDISAFHSLPADSKLIFLSIAGNYNTIVCPSNFAARGIECDGMNELLPKPAARPVAKPVATRR